MKNTSFSSDMFGEEARKEVCKDGVNGTRENVKKQGEFAETQKENGISIYLRERTKKKENSLP